MAQQPRTEVAAIGLKRERGISIRRAAAWRGFRREAANTSPKRKRGIPVPLAPPGRGVRGEVAHSSPQRETANSVPLAPPGRGVRGEVAHAARSARRLIRSPSPPRGEGSGVRWRIAARSARRLIRSPSPPRGEGSGVRGRGQVARDQSSTSSWFGKTGASPARPQLSPFRSPFVSPSWPPRPPAPSSPPRTSAKSSRATSAKCTTAACSTWRPTQSENGDWPGGGGENGPGTTGMGLMVFLACGEDPNFGPYSNHVRKAMRNIITSQDATTGIMGMSMYHHGFATLALAEAYGVVDERNLWPDGKGPRSIGQALELAVRGAVTSQKKNPMGAWRYSPEHRDADTSVSGAVFVGLLAARNAGIEVPDESIDKAISYYAQMTSASGEVGYTGGMGGFGESLARSSIATLVFSVARRKDLKQFKATLDYLKQRIDQPRAARLARIRSLLRGPGALSG